MGRPIRWTGIRRPKSRRRARLMRADNLANYRLYEQEAEEAAAVGRAARMQRFAERERRREMERQRRGRGREMSQAERLWGKQGAPNQVAAARCARIVEMC